MYHLKLEAINIADIVLGRLKIKSMNQIKATITNMAKEEKEKYLQELWGWEHELHKDDDINEGAV